MKTILAFAASNHLNSINKSLVKYACDMLKNNTSRCTVELIDLNDYEMPLYRQDRERNDGIPERAQNFYEKIGNVDAIIISFAEHNGNYVAAYKNIFDWASRINQKVYQNKPVLLLSTSQGKNGASAVLAIAKDAAPFYGMDVKATLSIPSFQDNFDTESERITDSKLNEKLANAIKKLTDAL